MKKLLPFLVVLLALGFVARSLVPPKNPGDFDVVGFGKLPALANGRFKPFDTVARVALRQFQRNQSVTLANHEKLSATEWLLDVFFRSEVADNYRVFRIDHPDVLGFLHLTRTDGQEEKLFAFSQIIPQIAELQRQVKLASDTDAGLRTPFQRATLQLYANLVQYQRLKHSLVAPGRPDFVNELLSLQTGVAAFLAQQAGQPHDEAAAARLIDVAERFKDMSKWGLLVVPPNDPKADDTAWSTTGATLLGALQSRQLNPTAVAYAGLGQAWAEKRATDFNKILELYRATLTKRFGARLEKSDVETRFNAAGVFTKSFVLYAVAFFAALFSWLVWPQSLGRTAFWLVIVAWLVATAGIGVRMWLEGRPPITNLYSSALYVGWGAVALCLGLEYFFRNAIGSAAAGIVGFGTLIVADRLQFSGDTLEMMQAVLDSKFWLATHVTVVASGYSATCLAGFLALIYVFRGVFTKTLDKATADSLARMVYGIVCFATLFSFVGTILGGIWADQSWGRFWGWDPKENGAVMIVLWNVLILHARWGGLIKQRGLMCLAIFGNVIFCWSWFGTNMLGVGLHSYGFNDGGFVALVSFVISQVVAILIANLPLDKWRSFTVLAGVKAAVPPAKAAVATANR
ncbi:MAG: cytochrome c biogenesis protein CcsA [Opitutaceae bacterium]